MNNMMQQKLQADALRNPGSGLNLGAPYLGPPQIWPQQQVNPGGQTMPLQAKPQGVPFQQAGPPQLGQPPQMMPPQNPPQLGQPPQIYPPKSVPPETPGPLPPVRLEQQPVPNRQIQPTGKY